MSYYALCILIEILSMFGVSFPEIIKNTAENVNLSATRLKNIRSAIQNSTASTTDDYLAYYVDRKKWGSYKTWSDLVTGVFNDINTLAKNSSMVNDRLVTPSIQPKTIYAIKWFAEMIYDGDVKISLLEHGGSDFGDEPFSVAGDASKPFSESSPQNAHILSRLSSNNYNGVKFTSPFFMNTFYAGALNTAWSYASSKFNFTNRYLHCLAISFSSKATQFSDYSLNSTTYPNILLIVFITNERLNGKYNYTVSIRSGASDTDAFYNSLHITAYKEDGSKYTGKYLCLNPSEIFTGKGVESGSSYKRTSIPSNSTAYNLDQSQGTYMISRDYVTTREWMNIDTSEQIIIQRIFNNMAYSGGSLTGTVLPSTSGSKFSPSIIGDYASLVNQYILVDENSDDAKTQRSVTPRLSIEQLYNAGTDITKFPAATCLGLVNIVTDKNPITGGTGESAISDAITDTSETDTDVSTPDSGSSNIYATNMFHVYTVTSAQLNLFSSYLWSSDISSTLKKMFSNPMDAIVSLTSIPFNPNSGSDSTIELGGIDTEISAKRMNRYTYEFSMGKVTISRVHGNFLDFAPYTHIQLYMPLIGFVDLDPNLVMGNSISVSYKYEILGGGFVARIYTTGNGKKNYKIAEYGGNCATILPISGANWGRFYTGIAKSVMLAGGASSPVGLIGAANTMANSGIDVTTKGSQVTNYSMLSQRNAYVVVSTPVDNIPDYYSTYHGIKSNSGISQIGTASGFNIFDNVKLNIPEATDDELEEIKNVLTTGVYL